MTDAIRLGLKENWKQFTILLLVNAFVGVMVGLERTIFPQFAEQEFGISSKTAILSFIAVFGVSKAISNYYTGKLTNRYNRRTLLIIGWLIALPIPFILIYAPNWNWVVFSNVLLGVSQGITWSLTIVMKIDLVEEKNRGLAVGLNEFSGYFAIGIIAYFTGLIAEKYGVTPYPFYLGIVFSIIGFLLTIIWVKDTKSFLKHESVQNEGLKLDNVFLDTTVRNKSLSSITQAGLINNLNDGMIWGLLPIFLMGIAYNTENIGVITALYPAFWGIGQLFTGRMSDVYSKKSMLLWGMLVQGIAITLLPFNSNFYLLMTLSILLGLGTATVYPTFSAAITDVVHAEQRAESLGVFRFWRDLGYTFGAIVSGVIADLFGIDFAIITVGILTIFSSLIIKVRMPKQVVN